MGTRQVEGWIDAQKTLTAALASGEIESWGIPSDAHDRIAIPRQEWIDLRIAQQGPHDELSRRDGAIAYRDVQVEAAQVRKRWPETKAMMTIRAKNERNRVCLAKLVERMKETPNDPVPKKELKRQFSDVSDRAFDALFGQAVRESGCVAWSRGGRRRAENR